MKKDPVYISHEEILSIHNYLIGQFGGAKGIHDFGLLESALARPRAAMAHFEAYPDIFMKAAVLGHSLIKNHPFIDGNKRTAVVAMLYFLNKNKITLDIASNELLNLALAIADSSLLEREIANWLREHCSS